MPGQGRYQPRWLVIEDPSGDFLGSRFDIEDLYCTAKLGNWPIGITWQNTDNHHIARYDHRNLSIIQVCTEVL